MKEKGWELFIVVAASVAGVLMLPGAIGLGIYMGLYVFCSAC